MPSEPAKTLGQAIDAIVSALATLDAPTRAVAINAACAHLGIASPMEPGISLPAQVVQEQPRSANVAPSDKLVDIRSLKEQKQPSNFLEMAALVAYYFQSLALKPNARLPSQLLT